MKEQSLKAQTIFLMVSTMHDYLFKQKMKALKEGKEELAIKFNSACIKLLTLKSISERILTNAPELEVKKAA